MQVNKNPCDAVHVTWIYALVTPKASPRRTMRTLRMKVGWRLERGVEKNRSAPQIGTSGEDRVVPINNKSSAGRK